MTQTRAKTKQRTNQLIYRIPLLFHLVIYIVICDVFRPVLGHHQRNFHVHSVKVLPALYLCVLVVKSNPITGLERP